MTHDLCKKLKDAGFPFSNLSEPVIYRDKGEADFYHEPTLSELIEACGDKFRGLNRAKDGKFFAGAWNSRGFEFVGDTPEEVVALLWLELNKKS